MFCGGVQIREGGPNPLADMDWGGPNPLADLDRGVQIRGGSKSAVTPVPIDSDPKVATNSPTVDITRDFLICCRSDCWTSKKVYSVLKPCLIIEFAEFNSASISFV